MRLVDTDVLIDIQRRYQPAVEWFASLDEVPGVPGFVVMELFQDAQDSRRIREVDLLVTPLARIIHENETRSWDSLPNVL